MLQTETRQEGGRTIGAAEVIFERSTERRESQCYCTERTFQTEGKYTPAPLACCGVRGLKTLLEFVFLKHLQSIYHRPGIHPRPLYMLTLLILAKATRGIETLGKLPQITNQ